MIKKKKWYVVVLILITCIVLNLVGRYCSKNLDLPIWLDSLGTVITAYTLGPWWGALVGASLNIINGLVLRHLYFIYALTSISVGIIVGFCAKKGMFKSLFGTLSASFLVTMASVVISSPLNIIFFEGSTNNMWGDGVAALLREWEFANWISCVIGEFYVDFLDKVIVLLLLFAVVRIIDNYQKKQENNAAEKLTAFILTGAVLIGVIPAVKVSAESEDCKYSAYIQTIYNNENGLPGGVVNDIAATEDGLMWIGTYSGLYRYNGTKFTHMDGFKSVKNVNTLLCDKDNRLWIGTNDSGLSIMENEKVLSVLDESKGLPSDSVRCIKQAPDGEVYVGTSDNMVIAEFVNGGLTIVKEIDGVTYANAITFDGKGNTAAVTNSGTMYFLQDDLLIDHINCETQGVIYTGCIFGGDGLLYLCTSSDKIEVMDISSGKPVKQREIVCNGLSNIKSVHITNTNEFLICADNGVGHIDGNGSFAKINTNKFNSSIEHTMVDYQGNIWFTSSRQGLLKLCEPVFTQVYDKVGLQDNVTNTVTNWQGNFYFGTDSGLDICDSTLTNEIKNELSEKLEDVRVRCLMVDSQNNLWISTSGSGVWCVSPDFDIKVYDSSVGMPGDKFRMTLELYPGVIAAAGDIGLARIENGEVTLSVTSKDGLRNPKVLCLAKTEDGELLAGTDGNGIAIVKDGKIQKTLHREDGLTSEVILRLIPEKDGDRIFIITSNGISYMDKNMNITALDNFPYPNNYDMLEYNGKMFILSSAGVYVIEKSELLSNKDGGMDFTLLNSNMGLNKSITPNSWNYCDSDNNFYISEDSGAAVLNLDNYDITPGKFKMKIKSVLIDGEEAENKDNLSITVPRGVTRIEVQPEIINFSSTDPYVNIWLEGFDSEPRTLLQSELAAAVYTNLHTGKYVLHIDVLDKAGNAVDNMMYTIIKEKEIYDNWWFMVYFIAVFVIAIVYLTWLIFRTQVKKSLELYNRELEVAKQQVQMSNEAIVTVARAVDARDKNTAQHSARVAEYSVSIAKRMGLSKDQQDEVRRTALLHDIGKIGIPDSILNKPARLNDEEYAVMKSHVVRGAEILSNFTSVENIVEGALYHHERYDGKGYVQGLKGEEIPLNARIIGIADAFDAMTANRVYRKKLEFGYVLEELRRGRGTQFDPKITDIMLELIDEGVINVEETADETVDGAAEDLLGATERLAVSNQSREE